MKPRVLVTRWRLAVVLAALIVAGATAYYLFVLPLRNPLRREPDQIAAYLLEQAPLGSTRDEVQSLVRDRGWTIAWVGEDETPGGIGARLGEYQGFPVPMAVYANWVFDRDGRLQEIRVRKAMVDPL